ncbi:unnamed protein product, partial [Cylicostephanus goldi]
SCPPTLVYNAQKGRCDYIEACLVKVEAQPPPEAISSTVSQQPLVPPLVSDASAPVSQQKMFDCKGKTDGFYSSGCSPIFYFCNEGLATPMNCPPSLVFNAAKGHCDYVENCSVEVPASAKDTSTSFLPPPAPSPAASSASSQVNCAGKKDGYYSNGCTSEFVLCSKGTATTMKCPPTLVFDEKKGHCDYVENCAHIVPPILAPVPVPPSPPSAASVVKETVQHVHPTTTFSVNCAGKKDGYYSNGCSAEFLFCSGGSATIMVILYFKLQGLQ